MLNLYVHLISFYLSDTKQKEAYLMFGKKKAVVAVVLLFLISLPIPPLHAQMRFGTTGLLSMPTADMQRDKTFMLGANMTDKNMLSPYWGRSKEYNPYTYNYYINITFFPWLEVAYTCTLVKGAHNSSYWPEQTWGKFVNQDRAFSGRLRLWKEGWWKEWTPQIVAGAIDPVNHEDHGGGDVELGGGNTSHLTMFYLAATKHFDFKEIGTLGCHLTYVDKRWNRDDNYKRPAVGVNFKFELPDAAFLNKALNGLNLMAEYDARTMNVGFNYSVWKDRFNLTAALNDGKYLSAGVYFRISLK